MAFHITISCDVYLSGGGGSVGASGHFIGYIANTSVMDCVRVGIIYGTKPWNGTNKSILCIMKVLPFLEYIQFQMTLTNVTKRPINVHNVFYIGYI